MLDNYAAQLETLLDLDRRHDELLERLDELDRRVEKVLAEWLAGRQPIMASATPK
jgi:tetrahydromethanopterin S-methyltransferase subunit G